MVIQHNKGINYSSSMDLDFEKYTGLKKISVPLYNDGRSDFIREFPSAKTTTLLVHYLKEGDTAILEFTDKILSEYGEHVRNFIIETFTYQYRKVYGYERLLVFRKNSLIFETPAKRKFSKGEIKIIH